MDVFEFDDSEFSGTRERKGPPVVKDVVLQVLEDKWYLKPTAADAYSTADSAVVPAVSTDAATEPRHGTDRDEDVLSGSNARLKWTVDHLYRTGEYERCLACTQQLRVTHLMGKEVMDIRARCCLALGRLDEAEAFAQDYCRAPGAKNPEGFALLARIQARRGDYRQALHTYQRCVNTVPVAMSHWERLADLYERLGCPASALVCLFAGFHTTHRVGGMFESQVAERRRRIAARALRLRTQLGGDGDGDADAEDRAELDAVPAATDSDHVAFPVPLRTVCERAAQENTDDTEDRQWFRRLLSPALLARAAVRETAAAEEEEGGGGADDSDNEGNASAL